MTVVNDTASPTALALEQPGALNTTAAVKVDEVDHRTYERNLARVQKAQLTVQMYAREVEHAQEALSRVVHDHAQAVAALAAKYNVDLDAMILSDDGYFMPRPPPRR